MRAGRHFVSLVPNAFNVRGQLVEKAWMTLPNLADWPKLDTKPGQRKADPELAYRGMTFDPGGC